MTYQIKAHPTKYAGQMFRSRLEANWAAFFDLAGFVWTYEPIDFRGWSPDFSLTTNLGTVYAEVKPVEMGFTSLQGHKHLEAGDRMFRKAFVHWRSVWVLLLGIGPQSDVHGIGALLDAPSGAACDWMDMHEQLQVTDGEMLWREAQNRTQWRR